MNSRSFFWSRARNCSSAPRAFCGLHTSMAEQSNRPRKRGRYNTHRRDVSLQKPKSTFYRHDHYKAVQLTRDEDEQSSEEITNFPLLENSEASDDSADECDPTIPTQNFHESGMSLPLSPCSRQELYSPDNNSDDCLEMNWSDVSEGDGSSYGDSFSDEEPENAVCGDNSIQTNESTDKDPYVYPGSQLKLSESVLLILTLAVTHNLNGSCLSDVISLINLHCIPGPLNKCVPSLNALKKYFVDFQLPITKHFYCKFCSEYLGVTGDTPDVCPICKKDVSDLKKEPYFVILSIENQLKELMQSKYR